MLFDIGLPTTIGTTIYIKRFMANVIAAIANSERQKGKDFAWIRFGNGPHGSRPNRRKYYLLSE
jgi:FlaA1/EpsC-like NDP-sugar epimerase